MTSSTSALGESVVVGYWRRRAQCICDLSSLVAMILFLRVWNNLELSCEYQWSSVMQTSGWQISEFRFVSAWMRLFE